MLVFGLVDLVLKYYNVYQVNGHTIKTTYRTYRQRDCRIEDRKAGELIMAFLFS